MPHCTTCLLLPLPFTEENNDKTWTQYKKWLSESLGEWRKAGRHRLKCGRCTLTWRRGTGSSVSSSESTWQCPQQLQGKQKIGAEILWTLERVEGGVWTHILTLKLCICRRLKAAQHFIWYKMSDLRLELPLKDKSLKFKPGKNVLC